MILKQVKADDGSVSYVETGENTLLGNMLDGLKLPFLAEGEFASKEAAFWGVVEYGTGIAAASSIVARSRQAAGAAPMLKVFF